MNFENLLFTVEDGIALMTINRPDKLNALNKATLDELNSAFEHVYNSSDIKSVILTGAGEKAFVAGADIKELSKLSVQEAYKLSKRGQSVFSKIEKSTKPVIAVVNGFALGGGCELALACHMRIAAENAKFGQPEVNLGLLPGYGGTQRLPRLVGKSIAMQLILTGEMISAEKACQYGLVNAVVKYDQVITEAKNILYKIMEKGSLAVAYSIEAIQNGLNSDLDTGMEMEASFFGMIFSTEDMKEGTAAFLEKRKAKFTGK